MSESLQQIRWVSQSRGQPVLYVLLSVPVLAALATAYAFASLSFPPGVQKWAFYGLFLLFGPWVLWLIVILTGPDGSRPPKVEAAARRAGLSFASRPVAGTPAPPPEFPLARACAKWLLPRRRGARNLVYGEMGSRKAVVFDMAYPFLGAAGRCETTAVYFPDLLPGLPDWPLEWSISGGPGSGNPPPEPFASVLAAHSMWTVECRGGLLLIYRLYYLCHPESYSEFVAAAAQVYADIASAANSEVAQGCGKNNVQYNRAERGADSRPATRMTVSRALTPLPAWTGC